MKRALKIIGGVVLALVLVVVGLFVAAFAGSKPVVDGEALPGGARQVKDGFVSVFVLDAGEGAVALIDAGNDKEGKAILAELARRKLGPDAVKAVFLTHGHSDHVAGLKVLPGAAVYGLSAEQPYLEGQRAWGSPVGGLAPAKDSGVRLTRALQDGETVTVGTATVQVFAAPGHTAGSAVYVSGGTAFLGDSADASSDGKLRPAKWVFSDDQATNVASLKALDGKLASAATPVQALAFAHSGSLQGLAPLHAFATSK